MITDFEGTAMDRGIKVASSGRERRKECRITYLRNPALLERKA
jgi:hypothetical protein